MKQVGSSRSHESARAHVTGSAKYVDDLWPSLAGTERLHEAQRATAERRASFETFAATTD